MAVLPLRIGGVLGESSGNDADAFLGPGVFHHRSDRIRHRGEERRRLPADVINFADRLRSEFRNGRDEDRVGAAALQRHDLRIHGRIGGFVGLRGHDHLIGVSAETVAQPVEIVLAEIVVLVEHRDLCIRQIFEDVGGVDVPLGAVARQPAHRPRKMLRIVPLVGAGGDEELRHLVVVQVGVDGYVGRRAERAEHQQYLVLLDQLPHLLDSLRRAVDVIAADEIYLAAVDATLRVDHVEVRALGLADNAVGRSWTAIGHRVADFDLGVAGAGAVLACGQSETVYER